MKNIKYKELRGLIIGKYGTLGKFAEAVEVSERTLSNKLHGDSPITADEIGKWSSLLGIGSREIKKYFLPEA